jgi:serine/threonine kinase 32
MLEELIYPFIIRLRYCFQDDKNLYMVIDYAAGGDLRFTLQKYPQLDDVTCLIYFAELASAITYMHSMNIVHRDIKPENILVNEDGHLLVTDFNLSANISIRKPSSQSGTIEV